MRARRVKPVIASMGSVAASGGYYISSAADEIWADPTTLTGSIGVFYGKVDVAQLAAHIGVTVEEVRRGAHAGADSIWRPFTPGERAILADKIRQYYRMFLRRVAEGRGMAPAAVDAVGRGRVWSGDRAVQNGLVDRLGGFDSALVRARQLAGLPPDASLLVVPFRPSSLLDYVTGGSGQEIESVDGRSPVRRAIAPAAAPARRPDGRPHRRTLVRRDAPGPGAGAHRGALTHLRRCFRKVRPRR